MLGFIEMGKISLRNQHSSLFNKEDHRRGLLQTPPARKKLDFDPVGHYARDDIFEFKVLNQRE